jgi:predicted dehydrogenase
MLNWAVVGKGMMGNIVAPILRQAGGEVTAVIARNPAGIDKFVESARLPNVKITGGYDDFERILKDRLDIDAVAILTPNALHYEQAKIAAQNGKHILIEKPFTISPERAHELSDIVTRSGVTLEINSQYRHHQLLDETLRNIIVTGSHAGVKYGGVTSVKAVYKQDWMNNPEADVGWRPIVEVAGKGKLVGDLGVHELITLLDVFRDGRIDNFEGHTYNVHAQRYKLKAGGAGTFGSGEVPSRAVRPDLYGAMDMLSSNFSGDDLATAKLSLDHRGNRIPVELYLSQVEREVRPNYFQVEVTFENGESIVWQQQAENRLEVFKSGEHQRTIHRHSGPSISGRPGGHNNGYGDAILKEMLKFEDAIKAKDSGYTARNLGMAVRAAELCADWTTKNPLKLYDPANWAHNELKPVAPTGRN